MIFKLHLVMSPSSILFAFLAYFCISICTLCAQLVVMLLLFAIKVIVKQQLVNL